MVPVAASKPGKLPAIVDAFVGRGPDLAELTRLADTHRLVTLTGPGGVGKSRLALEWAAANRPRYPDGVWFVPLASTGDGALMGRVIAVALEVKREVWESPEDALARRLADQQILLILDNCEHLIDESARLVGVLRQRCPGLTVLVTSREALRVRGEVVVRVEPLGLADPAGTGTQADAVRLFVERARERVPAFALTPQNSPTVSTICARLDGLPLAIELAARWVDVLSLRETLRRLDDRFALLTLSPRDVDDRHRSLRAAIEWSHALLSPTEKVVLRRLSVLPGGFDFAGATAVCAAAPVPSGEIFGTVTALVAKSLVSATEVSADVWRYQLAESVRLFAVEQLIDSGELASTNQRMTDWLVRLAMPVMHAPYLSTGGASPLDGEDANLLAAIEWSRDRDDDQHVLLVTALVAGWIENRYAREGADLLDAALSRPGASPRVRSLALHMAAQLANLWGDYGQAARLGGEAVAIQRRLGSSPALARALNVWAIAQDNLGESPAARTALRECVAILGMADDPMRLAMAQYNLAFNLLKAGELSEAGRLLDQAAPAYGLTGARSRRPIFLRTLGLLALLRDDLAGAERHFLQAARETDPAHPVEEEVLEGLAVVSALSGRAERAVRLVAAAAEARGRRRAVAEPWWQERLDAAAARARAQLPEEVVASARAAGRVLEVEQALRYDLDDAWSAPAAPEPVPLTGREREGAVLVARGLTNRQIARELAVSERTVEALLSRVRGKLGLATRAQIAGWVVEHRTPARRRMD